MQTANNTTPTQFELDQEWASWEAAYFEKKGWQEYEDEMAERQ